MMTKLTLSLNKSVIERAKRYAKKSDQSLSQIIESYLDKITSNKPDSGDSDLDAIRGVIKLSEDDDIKEVVKAIRQKKHG